MKSSTGSINPIPRNRFHKRLAIILLKRGFLSLVNHAANCSRGEAPLALLGISPHSTDGDRNFQELLDGQGSLP